MTRKRWIQDPKTGDLVPAEEYHAGRSGPVAPYVMGDLQPYQSMVTGEVIPGRRQHREHLRQHGVVEVGNEKLPPRPHQLPGGLKDQLIRATHQHTR